MSGKDFKKHGKLYLALEILLYCLITTIGLLLIFFL